MSTIIDRPGRLDSTDAGLIMQLRMMIQALWVSTVRNTLLWLTGALFVVVGATAFGQIRLNSWNQPFYDALSKRNIHQFLVQLGIFALLAGSLLVLNVIQRWLAEMLKLKLRQGLADDLIHNWLVPGRAFKLANAAAGDGGDVDDVGVNPDQRMHEDARHLTELSADLGLGLLQASILLVTFISVLWMLSNNFEFHFEGKQFAVPGYMVWAAVLYSGSASLLSYWVGRSLISRNSERYAREADLRFSLVRVNEHIDAITLAAGEADEARRIDADLSNVLAAMRRLVTGLTKLTWITAGYGWFTLVAPILVAAPLYFAGNISFGGLMMASGAFIQVQSSLRWFVDNFSTIADWRATLLRVAGFRRAVLDVDTAENTGQRIELRDGSPGVIRIDNLRIASPAGAAKLQETNVEIKSGERMLIVAESGTGKTLLFRALAGLWPWGSGSIARPKDEDFLYMPYTPYLPPGTLREVLAYPLDIERLDAGSFERALACLNLDRLVPQLDTPARWDHELSDDEHQSIALARLLLHRPRWVLIDEVLEALDEKTLKIAKDIFAGELQQAGVIYIGRGITQDRFFSGVLHLVKDSVPTSQTSNALAD